MARQCTSDLLTIIRHCGENWVKTGGGYVTSLATGRHLAYQLYPGSIEWVVEIDEIERHKIAIKSYNSYTNICGYVAQSPYQYDVKVGDATSTWNYEVPQGKYSETQPDRTDEVIAHYYAKSTLCRG